MKNIPNIFTLLNLFFGCLAITVILQNGVVIEYTTDGGELVNIPEKIWLASLFIFIAAIIDFLDGFVARLLEASTELGKQLDSLADVVTFGVAPSMIIFQFLRMSFAAEEDGLNISMLWLMPAFIIAMAAAYRLGKFNLDTRQTSGFLGLPTPAVGLLIASFPLIYWNDPTTSAYLFNKWVLYIIIFVLSWLMISELPMMAFKFKKDDRSAILPLLILILAGITAAVFAGWIAIPVVFVLYIILSLIFKRKS